MELVAHEVKYLESIQVINTIKKYKTELRKREK